MKLEDYKKLRLGMRVQRYGKIYFVDDIDRPTRRIMLAFHRGKGGNWVYYNDDGVKVIREKGEGTK